MPWRKGWSRDDLVTFVETRAHAYDAPSSTRSRRIFDAGEFLAGFRVPRWLVRRVIQRGFLYSLVALWGHGKTALALLIAVSVALHRSIGSVKVSRGRVLYLFGENADDGRLRVQGACQTFGVSASDLAPWLHLTDTPFRIGDTLALDDLVDEAKQRGSYDLVIVDTGPAHFSGTDENNNVDMHGFAASLRELMKRLRDPACIVLMHPAKGATRDNLQPRGGGAFSAAVDAELCLWLEDDRAEFWHRKMRGPGFERMYFEKVVLELEGVRDEDGEAVTTVCFRLLQQAEVDKEQKEHWYEENRLLVAISESPDASQRELAQKCAWTGADGTPAQWKVQRVLKRLKARRLIDENGKLTRAGKEGARRAA